jgi:hypothetical protein
VSKKRQRRTAAKRKKDAESRARTRQLIGTQLARPRVTEFTAVAVVPILPGMADRPSGAPGLYDIVFVLGVPGVSSVATSLNFDGIVAGGDSLLHGSGLQVRLESSDGQSLHTARMVSNRSGRLAQIHLTITANDFSSAEIEAFDAVMPTLSRIAFEADTPVEVTATLLTEQATQTRQIGATLVGAVQPAPEIAGTTTPELRMFLATYREGLNANSPLYQALSFFKIVEGITKFHTSRVRTAKKRGAVEPADPMARRIPAERKDLVGMTDWARDLFTPHLGSNFGDIRDAVEDTIRNAVAHISPGMDLRIADYAADIRACRDITPVLRYIARDLIQEELAGRSGAGPSAISPAA